MHGFMTSHAIKLFLFASLLIPITACTSPEEKTAVYIESGYKLLDAGEYTKASLEFRNALQINGNLVDALYGLALIEEQNQNWGAVLSILTKIQELNPNHYEARVKFIQLLLASGQLDKALLEAEYLIETFPDKSQTHATMAAVQFRLGSVGEAVKSVDRALSVEPANAEANLVLAAIKVNNSEFSQAIALMDKAIARNSSNPSYYQMKIRAYSAASNFDGIKSTLEEMIAVFPENNQFKKSLARFHVSRGNKERANQILASLADARDATVEEKLQFVSFLHKYHSPAEADAKLSQYIGEAPKSFELQFARASLLEVLGDEGGARSIYQDIIDKEDLNAAGISARNKIALLELRSGNVKKGSELVDEVLSKDKFNNDALYIRAGIGLNNGNVSDAIIDLRTILRDQPDSIAVLSMLGRAHQMNGEGELAKAIYQDAFKLNPAVAATANGYAELLLQERNYPLADEVLQESVNRGNRSARSLALLAQIKLALQDYEAAEKIAVALEKIEGQNAVSHQIKGEIHQKKSQFQESIEAFKEAHALAPTKQHPVVSLVKIYILTGEFQSAKSFLQAILRRDSQNTLAQILLVQVSLSEENFEEAEKLSNKYIESNPRRPIGYRYAAIIQTRLGRPALAEKIVREGIEKTGAPFALRLTLASVLERQKKYEQAIPLYRELITEYPNSLIVRNNLASLLTDYGNSEEDLQEAVQLSRNFKNSRIPQFRDTYAWAAVRSGTNLDEAVSILEGIVREHDSVADFHYHLGEAYRKKGSKDDAIAYLNKAIEHSTPGSDIPSMATKALQLLD